MVRKGIQGEMTESINIKISYPCVLCGQNS